ncbi:hypothetical protein Tco_0347285 [Tanacetum coccineum]
MVSCAKERRGVGAMAQALAASVPRALKADGPRGGHRKDETKRTCGVPSLVMLHSWLSLVYAWPERLPPRRDVLSH